MPSISIADIYSTIGTTNHVKLVDTIVLVF